MRVVIASLLALVPVVAGGLLLDSAITGAGRTIGLATIALGLAIPVAARGFRRAAAATSLGAIAVLASVAAARARGAHGDPAIRFVGEGGSWVSPFRVVPESDQLLFATRLLPWTDAGIARAGAERLRASIAEVYRDDPAANLDGIPSTIDEAVARRCSGRLLVYEPAASASPHGALLFVHGYGGSWQGYFRVMLEVARARGMVLVQPACGIGTWGTREEVATVERTRSFIADLSGVDASHIHLVALSNGGRAVTRALAQNRDGFRSVTLVSAVLEPWTIEVLPASQRRMRMPVLALHGADDDRVPMVSLERGVTALEAHGFDVTTRVFADEDHFVFFTARQRVVRELSTFLERVD